MSRPAEALIAAFQMLTRIPVPAAPKAPDERTVALSAIYYPWIGALLGAAGWVLMEILTPSLDARSASLFVLAFWALATGGLHEDGLADVADAFGSQRDREGLLRVMKDSRIGAYGALTLILATLARWTLLAETPPAALLIALLAAQGLSRAGIVLLAAWAGPATEGAGSMLARSLRAGHVAVACTAPLLLLLWVGPPIVALQSAASALMVVGAAAFYFQARLGGVTGDCLGAASILQEIAVLATVRAVVS